MFVLVVVGVVGAGAGAGVGKIRSAGAPDHPPPKCRDPAVTYPALHTLLHTSVKKWRYIPCNIPRVLVEFAWGGLDTHPSQLCFLTVTRATIQVGKHFL